ncbi:mitochondrial FAD carrier protein [Chlamydoabsidia padenii]|nr:mitochondrial FAD carrier protein [Chlamydoabsidia padenii]
MNDTKSFTASIHTDQALAGFTAGIVTTTLLHPLDVIKIRFQVNPEKYATNRPFIGGTIHSFKYIIQKEGILKGLYRGVITSVAGTAASWGLYFWCYSRIKNLMTKDEQGKLAAWQYLLSSAEAGAITVITTNPIWVIKTRLCSTTRYTPNAYDGFWNGLTRLVKEEGLPGIYRGMIPALFGVAHGAIQFMTYEEMKKWRNKVRHDQGDTPKYELNTKLNTEEYLAMAATSKITATITTYPYQVLRSRLQVKGRVDDKGGVVECVKKIKTTEGYVGFYKGLAPSVIRVLPGTCLTFLVYENMSHYFKEHATF